MRQNRDVREGRGLPVQDPETGSTARGEQHVAAESRVDKGVARLHRADQRGLGIENVQHEQSAAAVGHESGVRRRAGHAVRDPQSRTVRRQARDLGRNVADIQHADAGQRIGQIGPGGLDEHVGDRDTLLFTGNPGAVHRHGRGIGDAHFAEPAGSGGHVGDGRREEKPGCGARETERAQADDFAVLGDVERPDARGVRGHVGDGPDAATARPEVDLDIADDAVVQGENPDRIRGDGGSDVHDAQAAGAVRDIGPVLPHEHAHRGSGRIVRTPQIGGRGTGDVDDLQAGAVAGHVRPLIDGIDVLHDIGKQQASLLLQVRQGALDLVDFEVGAVARQHVIIGHVSGAVRPGGVPPDFRHVERLQRLLGVGRKREYGRRQDGPYRENGRSFHLCLLLRSVSEIRSKNA